MNKMRVNFFNRYNKSRKVELHKLSYLAGLIDGEGYVKIEKWGTIRLTIGMTNYKPIKWCHNNFGGTFDVDQITTGGKKFYMWRLNNSLCVLNLFILLYPFLMVKQKTVLQALKILKQRLIKHTKFHELK